VGRNSAMIARRGARIHPGSEDSVVGGFDFCGMPYGTYNASWPTAMSSLSRRCGALSEARGASVVSIANAVD
jgi:hypothetical protein